MYLMVIIKPPSDDTCTPMSLLVPLVKMHVLRVTAVSISEDAWTKLGLQCLRFRVHGLKRNCSAIFVKIYTLNCYCSTS